MKNHIVYGCWLPECPGCGCEIPLKRLSVMPYAQYCVPCQSKRDEYPPPPDFAMAEFAEPDDVARVREAGWGHIPEVRKPRTIKHPRVTAIFHLAS